jgi:predicted MFS family arabinose efflux permease
MGWVGASGGLSYMLGAPAIAYLASAGGWRLPFIAYAAAIPVAALALTLRRLPATPVKAEDVGLGEGFRVIASKRSALAALGAATLVGASSQSIYFYSFTYLREAQGASQGQVSLIFSAASLTYLLGSYSCGGFTDRLGLKLSLVTALGAALLSQAAYPYLPFWLGAALIVIAHFFFSLQYSVANALMLEQVPEYRGSMMSMSSALSNLGYGLGTAVGGAALSTAGWVSLNAILCLMGATGFLLYLYLVEA